MARTPLTNHWWNVPLYVTARGLTTSLDPGRRARLPDRLRLRRPSPRHRRLRRHRAVDRARPDDGRRVLRRAHRPARRARALHAGVDDAGRDPRRHPVRAGPRRTRSYDAAQVQRFWLALVQMDRVFARVPQPVRRQGQPGAPVLGWPRPRRHALLGPTGAAAPRWCAELRAARHARGVLARGEQRRLLARPRRRGRVLLLRLSRTARLRRRRPRRRRRRATTSSSASSSSRTRPCARRTTPIGCSSPFLQASYEAAADLAAWDRVALERSSTRR